MIDVNAMRHLFRRLHAVVAERAFGPAGVDALFLVMECVRELYKYVEPGRVHHPIVVFCRVAVEVPAIANTNGELFASMESFSARAANGLLVEVRGDGRIYLYPAGTADGVHIAQAAVVYEYFNGKEQFRAGNDCEQMIRFDAAADSQFAVPTFFTLRDALRDYAQMHVRYSACPIFSEIWGDGRRLFLKPGPEEDMRRSLTHFLKSRLGASYEVRPEQVMDETHPVDIKVTYTPAKRLMLIEIKWLGDSKNEQGNILQHRDARARAGANQLAGYLDQNQVQAPFHVTHGYYVIIDARRRGLREDSTSISREDGLHYANAEIAFDPAFHTIREDFDPPFRMFVEPIFEP